MRVNLRRLLCVVVWGTVPACRIDYEVLTDWENGGAINAVGGAAAGATGNNGVSGSSVITGGAVATTSNGATAGSLITGGAGTTFVAGGTTGTATGGTVGAGSGGASSGGVITGGAAAMTTSGGATAIIGTGGAAGAMGNGGAGAALGGTAGASSNGGSASSAITGGAAGTGTSGGATANTGGAMGTATSGGATTVIGTGGSIGTGGGAAGGASSPSDCQPAAFAGHTYLFCGTMVEWTTARDNCVSEGMHLVRVDDSAENQWLGTNAYNPTAGAEGMWLGGSDSLVEGEWLWSDDALFWRGDAAGAAQGGLFAGWYSNQPDTKKAAYDCAVLDLGVGSTFGWYDQECTGGLAVYVCESP